MRFLKKNFGSIRLFAMMAFMLFAVARAASSQPATAPRAGDVRNAARTEAIPGNARDVQLARPAGEWIGGFGIVEGAQPDTRVAPPLPGRIAAIHVHEGDRVTAGTLLVELESATEQASLAAAEADVAVSEAQLVRTQRGARPEDQRALGTDAQAAHARAQLSAGVLERLQAAAQGGGATVDEVERARRTADSDRLSALAADAREQSSRTGRHEDIVVAHAQLQAAIARRNQARATLDRLRIVAPLDGQVLQLRYRVGEYVAPGGASDALVTMSDTRVHRARIDVDERDIPRVAVGARALVTVEGREGRRFEGRVVDVGRRMGRKNIRTDEPTERIDTRILEVVIELGDDASALVVGQRVMGYVAAGPAS